MIACYSVLIGCYKIVIVTNDEWHENKIVYLKTLENGMHVSNRVSSLLHLFKKFDYQFIYWISDT